MIHFKVQESDTKDRFQLSDLEPQEVMCGKIKCSRFPPPPNLLVSKVKQILRYLNI